MRLIRPLLGVAAALVLAAVLPSTAHAHAVLETSIPASGEALAVSPSELVLDFDEQVSIDLGGVSLRFADGSPVTIGDPVLREGSPDVVAATLPPLAEGQYVVEFHVVSADGHPVSGNVVFRIGEGVVDATAGGGGGLRPVGLLYGIARLVLYPAVVVALGPWLFALVVWPPVWRRWHRAAAWAAVAAAAAAVAQFMLAAPYLSGGSLADVFSMQHWGHVAGTGLGRWLLVRVPVALVLAAVMIRRPAPAVPREGAHASVVVALGTALAVTAVGDGHAGAHGWLSAPFLGGVVHVLLMAGWLGGLVVMFDLLRRGDRWALQAAVARWSPTAMSLVVGIAATGVVQSWAFLPDWHLFGTAYGRLLLAKSLLVLAMVALGNLGRLMLRRRDIDRVRLGRSVVAELVLAIAVVVITTVMVQTNPSAGTAAQGAVSAVTTSLPAQPGYTTRTDLGPWGLTVSLDRAAVGRRSMTVRLDDSALPLVGRLSIKARITLPDQNLGPIPVLLGQTGDRTWSTTDAVEFPAAGTWQLVVQIDDASTSASFTADLYVAP